MTKTLVRSTHDLQGLIRVILHHGRHIGCFGLCPPASVFPRMLRLYSLMLKLLALPFRIIKLLITGLSLLVNAFYLFAKGLEKAANNLEKGTASLVKQAHEEREAKASEDRMVRRKALRDLNRKVAELEKATPPPVPVSLTQIETPIAKVILVPSQLRPAAPFRSISDEAFSALSSPSLASTVDLQTVSGQVSLLLFDLDGTLLDTADLEHFRGRRYVGPQGEEYVTALTEAYARSSTRNIYHSRHLRELLADWPELRFGVFTRSPRAYAVTLLNLGFPGFNWDTVVAFEDVVQTKPHGEGVAKAMCATGVSDSRRVALVGDDTVDVQAAYNAGCISLLETSSWARPNLRALEKIPDGILRGPTTLAETIRKPVERLPALEQALISFPSESGNMRFDAVPHSDAPGTKLDIFVLGRLFTENPDLANRIRWHGLTKSIVDNKSSEEFPAAWTFALGAFLQKQLGHNMKLVVTVIPAKNGRVRRMEHLLDQLKRDVPSAVSERCTFVPDLLQYASGAKSHSAQHLNRAERMENARMNLSLRRSEIAVMNDIIVIDDVVTSGATMIHAHRSLLDGGARSVTCVALAKAVRSS